jgi:hypothetical protein
MWMKFDYVRVNLDEIDYVRVSVVEIWLCYDKFGWNWRPYSSIYVFKHPSSSAGRDFADAVLNMGGSGDGDNSDTSNDAAPWLSCAICDVFVS